MTKKYSPLLIAVIVLWISQLACNLPSNDATPDPFATLNGMYTASAQTLAAATAGPGLSATPGLPQPTPTVAGSATVTNQPMLQTPGPPSRCDAAQFLAASG